MKKLTLLLLSVIAINCMAQEIDYNKLLIAGTSSVKEVQIKFNLAINAYNENTCCHVDTMDVVGRGDFNQVFSQVYDRIVRINCAYGELNFPIFGKSDVADYYSFINKIIIKELYD